MSPTLKQPLAIAWVLALAPPLAGAQDAGGSTPGTTVLPEVTSYRFDDDLVAGDQRQPDGTWLVTRTRGARESLVRARLHFVDELCRSIEQL